MQLDAIRLFCDVASQRSVSGAAKVHGITQSAASQRIQALEKELGVGLIDRSTRPLQLTPAGEVYHQGVRRIIDSYESLCRQIMQADRPVKGDVTVAAIYSVGIDLLNQVQEGFEAEHPHARLVIHYLHPEQVHQRLLAGQVDVGILSYPERWRDLGARHLRNEAMAVVCPPSHRLATSPVVGPSDLEDEPLVMFDSNLPIHRRIHQYLRGHGVRPKVEHAFDNIDTIKTCVMQGGGVAILPARTVRSEAQRGLLAVVQMKPELVRPLGVVYRRGRDLSPLVRLFIDYLTEHQPSPREFEVQEPDTPDLATATN